MIYSYECVGYSGADKSYSCYKQGEKSNGESNFLWELDHSIFYLNQDLIKSSW